MRCELVLEVEDALDAGEVEPDLARQPLDQLQPRDVLVGVEPRVAGGALAAGRAPSARRSAASAGACRRARRRRRSCSGAGRPSARTALSRGLASRAPALVSLSSASRSAFVSFAGTLIRSRASRSPRPEPLSFGAPRPLTRRSLPSWEPAGTFSDTRPSGVGISTVAPSAASSKVDRHLEHEVVAAALVELRGLDARDDEEVAGGRAAPAGLALALELDLRAVLDARPGSGRGSASCAARGPQPWQVGHGVSTIVPMPRQFGHGCWSAKSPCEVATTPLPSHCGQRFGAVPGRRAGAVAGVAGELERDRHRRLQPLQRVLERDPHLDLDVGAALAARGSLPRRRPRPPKSPPKMSPRSKSEKSTFVGPGRPLRRAEGVVLLALLGVAEHVVGLLHLLEARLGAASPGFLSGWYWRASLR